MIWIYYLLSVKSWLCFTDAYITLVWKISSNYQYQTCLVVKLSSQYNHLPLSQCQLCHNHWKVLKLPNSYQPSCNLILGFKHIFWSVIVCVAMGCAAIFLYSNTIDFMNATVVTTVDTMTVPLSEVFFPSVVVCNINQVNLNESAVQMLPAHQKRNV